MINENEELDFILDFYDIDDECGCTENYWCNQCLADIKYFNDVIFAAY